MQDQSSEIIKHVLEKSGASGDRIEDFNKMTIPKIYQLCSTLSLIFNLQKPNKNASKKTCIEFLILNIDYCKQQQPQWLAADSRDDFYVQIAKQFNVIHLLQDKLNYQSIQYDSFLYKNYKHIGLFKLNEEQNKIQLLLDEHDLNILKQHQSATIVFYVFKLKNLKTELINPSFICFNGKVITHEVQPYVIVNTQALQQNLLQINCTNEQDISCLVYLAKKLSNNDIFSQLLKKPQLTSKHFAQAIKQIDAGYYKKFQIIELAQNEVDEDQELESISETVKLISQISLSPITMPVRGGTCRHFNESMDLNPYIYNAQNTNQLNCDICKTGCKFSQLYIDAMAYFLITKGYRGNVEIKNNNGIYEINGSETHNTNNKSESSEGWDL